MRWRGDPNDLIDRDDPKQDPYERSMSTCRLKSYDAVPPNCYSYTQTEGIVRRFGREPVIEALAKAVSAFRQGNRLPRASIRETLEDVDEYNAVVVLGCDARWTNRTETGGVALAEGSGVLAGCKGCGAPI